MSRLLFLYRFCAAVLLVLPMISASAQSPSGNLPPPRIGPVPPNPIMRPPFASEVTPSSASGEKGTKSLLPGLPLDTSFNCLKWMAQGPAPGTNGDLNINDHPYSGCVSAIAPHPTDPNIVYIGTVNGGVWRGDNVSSTNITWTPLTDDQLSLSIGALALDPTDASGQTLVAGIGRRSSFGRTGGALIGLLRTTTGGASWTRLGATALAGKSFYSVAVRGNLILAGVEFTDNGSASGLFRTTDGGVNFTNMSGFGTGLPAGAITHLTADPGNTARFFAHVQNVGVFRSDDSGANWINVTAGLAPLSNQSVALAVFNRNSTNVVYAAELTGTNSRVYRSINLGTNWTQMDSIVANASGFFNGFTADPANPNLVYLSGLFVRAGFPFSGRVVRGDASLPGGSQWTSIASTNGTGNGTAPHTDSRAMTFTAGGMLVEGDDGGIYGLSGADTGNNGTTSRWRSLNSNLQVSEMHSMAYDRVAKIFLGGAQDTGAQEQVRTGQPLWNKTSNGDGGDAAVDVTSIPGQSIRYESSQNLGGFYRATYNANNVQLNITYPSLTPLGTSQPMTNNQFVTPIALNAVSPLRLIFGINYGVYETFNQGNTVTNISPGLVVNSPSKTAYGGRIGTVTNAAVIYLGAGNSVFIRTNASATLAATPAAFPGGSVQSIVTDPADYRIAYVVGTTNIYSTANAGASWANLTGNLVGAGTFHSVEFLTLPGGNAIVVGADVGAYIMRTASPGVWKTLGSNLPNAPVFDTHYDPVGNVLAISTFGRGAWLYDFNPAMTNVVTVFTDGGPGSLRDAIEKANFAGCPNYISFSAGGMIILTSSLPAMLTSTVITGRGTNTTIINGSNAYDIFAFVNGTTNKLSAARLINAFSVNHGAAIRNSGYTVIENCVITNSFTIQSFGGAVCNAFGGSLFATNCVFIGNRIRGGDGENRGAGNNGGPGGGGAGMGGAIYSDGPQLALHGCTFTGNLAIGGNGGNGDGNSFNNDTGGNGGFPNRGTGGAVGQPGGAGGFGGGGGGGAGSFAAGFAGGAGGFGGGGGAGGARGGGGNGGAAGAGGTYGGNAGGSFSSHSGGGGGGAGLGGAVCVSSGTVAIVNCAFNGNLATNGGGGVGSFGGGNGANGQGSGGALFNLNAKIIAAGVNTFSGNAASTGDADVDASTVVTTLADSGPGSLRQAICNAAVRPGADTVTFATNLSGGVLHLTSAPLDINDVSGPLTITVSNLPGGLLITGDGARSAFVTEVGSAVTLESLTLTNCVAPGGTGGAISANGSVTLRRCTLVNNHGSYVGGVIIWTLGTTLVLDHSTLFNNSADNFDGGLFAYGDLEIRNSTIVSNRCGAVGAGGGARGFASVLVQNSILAGNVSGTTNTPQADDLYAVNYSQVSYSLIGGHASLANGVNGNIVGTIATPIDPRLGPLRNNGGLTLTMTPLGGSPAVDAGDPLFNGFGLTDQRGAARVSNGRIDIGSVEGCLRTFYSFDAFTVTDATGVSTPAYMGFGPNFWNSDHRGQANSAIALNDPGFGTNNYYRLTTPGDPTNSNRGLGLKRDFTVSAWIYPRVVGPGDKMVLGNTGPGDPGTLHLGLRGNHTYFGFWGNDIAGNFNISPNQYIHVAWTYNSLGGIMSIYVNGQLDASAVGRPNTTKDADVLIGYAEAIGDSYFQGFIDELAIFCEALSPSQITALAAPNGILPNATLPAPVLSPGLAAPGCGWNVREIYAHTNDSVQMPYDLASAEHIANTPSSGKVTNYNSTVINRHDPETNPGAYGFIGGDVPFAANNLTPQGLINGDDNYFVLAAQTTIQISVEDDYTFGFSTDDGARLRIKGAVFSSSTRLNSGNPANPAHRNDTLSFPDNSGDSQTLGVTHLKPGSYDVEFITWEWIGGSFAEVIAARGAKTSVDSSFALLSPLLFTSSRPSISITRVPLTSNIQLNWNASPCFHLQSAGNILGPWFDVPNGTNGIVIGPLSGVRFYRLAE